MTNNILKGKKLKKVTISVAAFTMGASLITSLSSFEGSGGGTQTAGWNRNYKMANVMKCIGSHEEWHYYYCGPMCGSYYYPVIVMDYQYVPCCIQATDSDACNFSMESIYC